MRDLLRQFGSVPLALAAYNAGPGPVSGLRLRAAHTPRRRGYVARILGLMSGAGVPIPLGDGNTAGGAACQVSAPASAEAITPARRRPASSRSGSDRLENDRRISL